MNTQQKNYKVINGDMVYLLVTPEEAEHILSFDGKHNPPTKIYALTDNEQALLLQTQGDVRLYVEEEGVTTFGIEVGKIADMLLNMYD